MENSNNISLRNRRILVVLLVIFLVSIFLPFFTIARDEYSLAKYTTSIVSLIAFFIIAYYLRLRTDAFLITTYGEEELDERQYLIRLKAQRDAYNYIIILLLLILPTGIGLLKNEYSTFISLLFALIIILRIYLPTMIIAWHEKEV